MRRLVLCVLIAAVAGAAACHKTDSKSAVVAAIQKHLDQNRHLMLNSFSTKFETVELKGETADALVKFQSKSNPQLAVEVSYGLKKIGGQWQVVSSSSGRGQLSNPANPHAGVTLDQTPPPSGTPSPMPSH